MSYFWTNLGTHLLVSLILLIIFLTCVKNNQKNRWKKGFLFFLPFVCMIILLVQLAIFSIPRILDTTTVLLSTYRMGSGKIEAVNDLKNIVVIDGETYYVNPFSFELKEGDEVNIKYTPYAHYAYSVELKEKLEDVEEGFGEQEAETKLANTKKKLVEKTK